jgi:putative nucleotidyltransferase with HDIG domain
MSVPRDADDPVLTALGTAGTEYVRVRDDLLRNLTLAEQAAADAARAREAERQMAGEVDRLRAHLERERKRAARMQERARQLADAVKDLHQAFFSGNVYDLILRACMTITGATRGVYVTTWGADNLRIRAAVDVDGYPKSPPSDFLRGLCRKVAETNDTLVVNSPDDHPDLPKPQRPGEQFRDFLVAPAVILERFNGIVLLADKAGGGFDDDDVDTVLGIGKHAAVAVENRRLRAEVLGAYFSVVGILADAVEAKDPYTRGHCEQVAAYARRTAERLGLDEAARSVVCFGGLLHDVGKIGVSDGILNKPGKLLPEEWTLMQSHVRIGRDLLDRVPALRHVADVVMHHHEHYDGRGYPEGLRADQISLAARIICVADSYCAMTSKRSYKESMTPAAARAELLKCKGTHFDPAVVDAFLAALDDPRPDAADPDHLGESLSFYHPQELERALERAGANGDSATPASSQLAGRERG